MLAALRPVTTDATLATAFAKSVWGYVQGMSLHQIDPSGHNASTTPTEADFRIGLEVLLDGLAAQVA